MEHKWIIQTKIIDSGYTGKVNRLQMIVNSHSFLIRVIAYKFSLNLVSAIKVYEAEHYIYLYFFSHLPDLNWVKLFNFITVQIMNSQYFYFFPFFCHWVLYYLSSYFKVQNKGYFNFSWKWDNNIGSTEIGSVILQVLITLSITVFSDIPYS